MSKDKYPSIFSSLKETIVFTIIIFFILFFLTTRAVLKIREYLTTSHRSGGG